VRVGPRGEFSIVIAGLATGMPQVGTLAAAYVLVTAIGGPIVIRLLHGRLS
jgi:CPA2 family monovalent cation:H+ antiporter-2